MSSAFFFRSVVIWLLCRLAFVLTIVLTNTVILFQFEMTVVDEKLVVVFFKFVFAVGR